MAVIGIKPEVLNDLASRFLINLRDEDKDDPLQLVSHMETAYWFYLDLQRQDDPSLPACSMKEFMATIFNHCPFLVRESATQDLDKLLAQWKSHKFKKPLRGGIVLNPDHTKCLLVQGYPASTTWGFPKGKLEKGENDMDAAVREIYEETGLDTRSLINEDHYLEATINGNKARMYIISSVPEDTPFAPKVRKEIRDIQWFKLEDLPHSREDQAPVRNLGKKPNTFFTVIPFMSSLKKWITAQKQSQRQPRAKMAGKTSHSGNRGVSASFLSPADPRGAPQGKTSHNKSKSDGSRASSQTIETTSSKSAATSNNPVVVSHTGTRMGTQPPAQLAAVSTVNPQHPISVPEPVDMGMGPQYPSTQYHLQAPTVTLHTSSLTATSEYVSPSYVSRAHSQPLNHPPSAFTSPGKGSSTVTGLPPFVPVITRNHSAPRLYTGAEIVDAYLPYSTQGPIASGVMATGYRTPIGASLQTVTCQPIGSHAPMTTPSPLVTMANRESSQVTFHPIIQLQPSHTFMTFRFDFHS